MANTRTFNRSFSGGELSPEMFGRLDDNKYQTGAALLKNFVATPQGPAENRPGFAYVNATKSNGRARLIPFTYSTDQTMVIEIGAGYFRFHTLGATLLSVGVPYEVTNPYTAGELFDIHYVQSSDVLTLVHPNHPPAELKRLGPTSWTYTPIAFTPTIDAPTGVAVTDSPGYKALIASISIGSPALITTVASHTLSLGDGIYIKNLTAIIAGSPVVLDGPYLVNKVPVDADGNLIPNQLQVMDYDGNLLDSSGWDSYSGGTIQLGTKIFDITNYYAVTAVAANGVDESVLSSEVSVLNNLNVTGSYNTITWTGVTGAIRYYIYKKKNGLYGYIGETTGTSFVDNNIAADMGITPPIYETLFGGAGDYPAAVSYHEQRRCFAGSNNQPQNLWMSKSGTETDFSYSLPTKDTDRVSIRVAAREANTIRHIVPLSLLVLLTSAAEWKVAPENSGAITPTDVGVKPQSYVGASNVQPNIVNNSLVYCAARGGHVRELGYSWQSNGFVTGDISLRAAHLFDNLTIVDQCYSKAPRPILWFVSSNGKLLGLTYIPEEQVGAWHQHSTDGYFESVTAVAEGNEDRLYAVIRRTVNGNTVRYVERMASRQFDTLADAFFVDAGSTYSGAPATTISGLTWLEGKTVAILADGAVCPQRVVTGGAVTLDHPASVVHVGLPYQSDLQTLPLELQIDGYGQGRTKNINKCFLRVWRSSGIFVGPDETHLTEAKQRTTENYGNPPTLKSEEVPVTITPSWQSSGQVFIRQSDPLPLSIVALTMEVSIGG